MPETDNCLLVGPIEPATNRRRSGVSRFISSTARRRQGHAGQVQLAHVVGHREVGHRHPGGAERVRLDDVGPRLQVFAVDLIDRLGLGDRQHVDEILQILAVGGEAPAAVVLLGELVGMDHRPHRPVEDRNPLG